MLHPLAFAALAMPIAIAAATTGSIQARDLVGVTSPAFLPYEPTNCAKCVSCNPSPGEAGHVVYLHDGSARDGSTAHECLTWGTDACSVHGSCGGGGGGGEARRSADVEDVDALFRSPTEFALTFMQKYPELTLVNLERNALQIRGCADDVVIGHIELPANLAVKLSAFEVALAQ